MNNAADCGTPYCCELPQGCLQISCSDPGGESVQRCNIPGKPARLAVLTGSPDPHQSRSFGPRSRAEESVSVVLERVFSEQSLFQTIVTLTFKPPDKQTDSQDLRQNCQETAFEPGMQTDRNSCSTRRFSLRPVSHGTLRN